MIAKYIYINKKTGEKILTNTEKDDVNLVLVQEIKGVEDFKNLITKQCIAKKVM